MSFQQKKNNSYNSFKREMSSSIDAAALQNDIAIKYNLPGMSQVQNLYSLLHNMIMILLQIRQRAEA
jgi:hypothetical protein